MPLYVSYQLSQMRARSGALQVALRPDDLVNDAVEDGVDSLALTRKRKQTMPFFALQYRISVSFTFIISMICCLQRDTSLCGRSIFVITGMISRF